MLRKIFVFSLMISFLVFPAQNAQSESIYPLFQGKTVKVYVGEVKDSTKEHEVNPVELKAKLESALKNRKSITFQVVQTAAEANLLVEMDIQEFIWTDHDPIDMIMGVGATAMDAAVVEDYARLQANISVTDPRTNKVLWKDKVMATVTKKPMSRAESIPLVSEDLAKVFVKECFAKKRAR